MNSTYFPHFTIGSDAYDKIPDICGEYGKTAVIIGGTKARIAAEPLIRKAVSGKIDITGSFLYGDDATFENAEALTKIPEIQEADMIFAVGGGRATDTCKWAAHLLKKPIFTFPTLASNCASVTAVCIMYNPDHSFKGSIYRERGAWHTFINTEIIAHSPRQYFWAGLGDALAKQYEVPFSARGMDLTWIQQTGVNNAQNVAPGILKYGKEALADVDKGIVTDALEAATLSIIVAPGMASVCIEDDLDSSSTSITLPLRRASLSMNRSRRADSAEWIIETNGATSFTLFVCRPPIRCHSMSPGSSACLAASSCGRFSPKTRWPAS